MTKIFTGKEKKTWLRLDPNEQTMSGNLLGLLLLRFLLVASHAAACEERAGSFLFISCAKESAYE